MLENKYILNEFVDLKKDVYAQYYGFDNKLSNIDLYIATQKKALSENKKNAIHSVMDKYKTNIETTDTNKYYSNRIDAIYANIKAKEDSENVAKAKNDKNSDESKLEGSAAAAIIELRHHALNSAVKDKEPAAQNKTRGLPCPSEALVW